MDYKVFWKWHFADKQKNMINRKGYYSIPVYASNPKIFGKIRNAFILSYKSYNIRSSDLIQYILENVQMSYKNNGEQRPEDPYLLLKRTFFIN